MKSLSSSSSSLSSIVTTSTASVDGNIQTPKSSAIGCISGMVRRLLCRNSLPTYPSDQLKLQTQLGSLEAVKLECFRKEIEMEASSAAAPGLVARLMGLESLPSVTVAGNEKSSPDSISRSRSMNSVDALKELASIQGNCRRVKSFREIPTFIEDDEFLILSFENAKKSKRRKSVNKKNKENLEPNSNASNENSSEIIVMNSIKKSLRSCCERKMKDSSNVRHCAEKSCRDSLAGIEMGKSVKALEFQDEKKIEKNVTRGIGKERADVCLPVKKIEAECDSKYSSPDSVLDDSAFPCDSQITDSVEHSRLKNSKRRRTLTEELQNYMKPCLTKERDKDVKLKKNEERNDRHIKIWSEIGNLVEKDVTESVWMHKGIQKLDYSKEEFLGEIELEILDELLDVMVDQLYIDIDNHN